MYTYTHDQASCKWPATHAMPTNQLTGESAAPMLLLTSYATKQQARLLPAGDPSHPCRVSMMGC
jgi:hypothetical protein